MIEQLNNRIFHINNSQVSFILHVMQNGQIEQIYYGKPLHGLSVEEIDYLVTDQNKSAGTVKFLKMTRILR